MTTNTQRDAVGTAYLDPATGDLYRLRDYGVDWRAEPFTGEHTVPTYTAHFNGTGNSTVSELPAGVVVVWRPDDADTED